MKSCRSRRGWIIGGASWALVFAVLLALSCETVGERVFTFLAPIIEEEIKGSDKGENPPGGGHGKGGSKDTTGTTPPDTTGKP